MITSVSEYKTSARGGGSRAALKQLPANTCDKAMDKNTDTHKAPLHRLMPIETWYPSSVHEQCPEPCLSVLNMTTSVGKIVGLEDVISPVLQLNFILPRLSPILAEYYLGRQDYSQRDQLDPKRQFLEKKNLERKTYSYMAVLATALTLVNFIKGSKYFKHYSYLLSLVHSLIK